MFQKIAKMMGGDPNKKEIEKSSELVDQINAFEPAYEALSDEALRNKQRVQKRWRKVKVG